MALEAAATAAAEDTAEKRKYTLRSSDGEIFQVEEEVALQCRTIKHMIEDDCAKDEIPLPNVSGPILAKVIEYCRNHMQEKEVEEKDNGSYLQSKEHVDPFKAWDAAFLEVDQDTLFDLIMAANYLDINGLFYLTTKNVVDQMRGKSPEELRKIFHISNDYTPEEEAEVRRENSWAFD